MATPIRFSRDKQLAAEERRSISRSIFRWIYKADYRRAMALAAGFRARYPGEFFVEKEYASVLGDYAESCPGVKRLKLHRESVRLLRDLLRRTRCEADPRATYILRNEYYWQTKNRLGQYALGVEENRGRPGRGWYSQGVGAAWHAYELALKGRRSRAERWAKRALHAWSRFERRTPDYYNAFVHRALAAGVLGWFEETERSLAKAAKLSGKRQDYREFREVRELLHRLWTRR